jgi:hypothetical protein
MPVHYGCADLRQAAGQRHVGGGVLSHVEMSFKMINLYHIVTEPLHTFWPRIQFPLA